MHSITTTHDGQPVTTTLAIAEGVQMRHEAVIKLTRRYQDDLGEFGLLDFKSESLGGRPTEYAFLNEQQSTLLMTYMRNSDVVRAFKKRLVKAFWEMAQAAKLSPSDQAAAYIATLRQQAQSGAAAQAELDRILGTATPAAAKALPAPSKQKQDWRDIPVRVFRCARPNERRPTPVAYAPPILDVRLEDIPSRWMPVIGLTSYLSAPVTTIGHALWACGLVEWDGWPTDEGLAAGVRLCGPEGDPDIEVDARRVARALKARPRMQWCSREENYVPIYRR